MSNNSPTTRGQRAAAMSNHQTKQQQPVFRPPQPPAAVSIEQAIKLSSNHQFKIGDAVYVCYQRKRRTSMPLVPALVVRESVDNQTLRHLDSPSVSPSSDSDQSSSSDSLSPTQSNSPTRNRSNPSIEPHFQVLCRFGLIDEWFRPEDLIYQSINQAEFQILIPMLVVLFLQRPPIITWNAAHAKLIALNASHLATQVITQSNTQSNNQSNNQSNIQTKQSTSRSINQTNSRSKRRRVVEFVDSANEEDDEESSDDSDDDSDDQSEDDDDESTPSNKRSSLSNRRIVKRKLDMTESKRSKKSPINQSNESNNQSNRRTKKPVIKQPKSMITTNQSTKPPRTLSPFQSSPTEVTSSTSVKASMSSSRSKPLADVSNVSSKQTLEQWCKGFINRHNLSVGHRWRPTDELQLDAQIAGAQWTSRDVKITIMSMLK